MIKNKTINEVEWADKLLKKMGFRELSQEEIELPEFKSSIEKSRQHLNEMEKGRKSFVK